MMIPSMSGFFSLMSTLSSLGRWVWAAYEKLEAVLSSFRSKKRDFPDTEQGRRLQQALRPDSLINKVAHTWAYASLWTKSGVLAGTTLVCGLLGLAFGASLVLSIASMVIGLSIHGLLVAHHEKRVQRIMSWVNEQEVIREEVETVLKSVQADGMEFIQAQKKEHEATLMQFKQETEDLTKVVEVVEEQVAAVVSTNTQLEEVGQHIETTLHEVKEQGLAWNKGLEQHQEVLGTVHDATHAFSELVDKAVHTHKAFDCTVGELHEAVAALTKPGEGGGDEASDIRIDLSGYTERTLHIKEQLDALEARSKQRQEHRAKDADLLIEESLLVTHREGIQATDAALGQLEVQRKVLTAQQATNDVTPQLAVMDPTARAPHWQESEPLCSPASEVFCTDLAWLESVQKSIGVRQERMDTFNNERISHDEVVDEHETFVDSMKRDLNARSEQRRARRAQLEAACCFFAYSVSNPAPDELSRLNISIY